MQKTEAIVIRKLPHGEADFIVDIFTRDFGKLRCMAKNARKSKKRFGGRLEPFLKLSVILRESRGGKMALLSDAQVKKIFPLLQSDLGLFSWGTFVLETIDLLTPAEDPDPQIFDLAIDTMEKLNANKDALETVMDFQLRILSLAGYGPNFKIKRDGREENIRGIKTLTSFTEAQTGKRYKSLKFLEELRQR